MSKTSIRPVLGAIWLEAEVNNMAKTFLGYRRAQGRAGVRNWIAVISVMDNCNPVTRAISQAVAGTIPVTAMFVRIFFDQYSCGKITLQLIIVQYAHAYGPVARLWKKTQRSYWLPEYQAMKNSIAYA